jgi:hypothetical protein
MRTDTPPVSEVVERAAAICDPHGHDDVVNALVERFQDDDRPARSVPELWDELRAGANEADPAGLSTAAQVTAAAAVWLATNAEFGDDRERVLREAVRAAYDGRPPEPVEVWLSEQGVAV